MPERKHLFLYEVFPKWMVGNFRENPKRPAVLIIMEGES